jgi:uncharacterized protein (TIGR03663 family)
VGTASTRSVVSKQRRGEEPSPQSTGAGTQLSQAGSGVEISNRAWVIASVSILFVAALLRFYDLDLVPLHHDEGVNGNFLIRLVREGFYQYDPANYHGPTLYYFAALFPRLLRTLFGIQTQNSVGLTTTAIRFVPALFGLATVALVFTLRRNLGTIATLSAAALLAISPGAVYLSRYFIHESLFVFFTLAMVVAGLKYYERAHPTYLLLASLSAALLFATKETAIISVVVLVLALVLSYVYRSLRWRTGNATKRKKGRDESRTKGQQPSFVERAGGAPNLAVWIAVAVAVFIAVNVLFYSSFFRNFPKGIWDAIKTFEFWSKTGKEAHGKPASTYIWWLLLQESPLLLLGAIGAMLAVFRPTKAFALFSALWAFGLIAAYSLITYKTPWLTLSFIVPLALCSGYAIEWIYEELSQMGLGRAARTLALGLVLLLATGFAPGIVRAYAQDKVHWKTFIPGYQTFDLNFRNYDNDDPYYVYVYAHTRRDLLKLVDEIDRIAQRTHQGGQTGITIVSPEYWPLPWYLRDYNRVGYHGRMAQTNEPIIIASQAQAAEMESMYGDRYQEVQSGLNNAGTFSLRPGVDLLLYTRRELVK